MDENEVIELTTFTSSSPTYVYVPLPPVTSYGHRAELWNPDKWFKEVKTRVVTAGDLCYVRMIDHESGELFAECPLPSDGTSLTTVVEPVVDSSRYFVVKVVDRESRKHAFIGIGFRERSDASDFSAALDDYRQYLRRKQEAEQMRQQFDKQQLAAGAGSAGPGGGGADGTQGAADGAGCGQDFSLKPGQTIRINLSPSIKRSDSGKVATSSSSSSSPQVLLAPPRSSGGFFKLQPPPPAAAGASSSSSSSAAAAAAGGPAEKQQLVQHQGGGSGMGPASNPGTPREAADADDGWGDFVG